MCESIVPLIEQLKEIFNAEKIYVFGVKYNSQNENEVTDFDVCIVADFNECERNALLKRAYMESDCDIPFDIFLYTPSDFDELSEDPASFVSRVLRIGRLYYGKR